MPVPEVAHPEYHPEHVDHPPHPPELVEARHRAREPKTHERKVDTPQTDQPRLPYLPGLDGLKGIALLAVLAFSHGIAQVRGGFLAISTALTLSGFLLGAAMLAGWSQRRRLSLRQVWEWRARRLIPALYAVVLAVVVLQVTLRVGAVPTFRGDVWAALGLATNWRLAFAHDGFTASFSELSGLSHLWPVAVIAQLAILVPLVSVGLMTVTGRHWRTVGALFGLLALASFWVAWVVGHQASARDLVYYGTHTRAGEVLVGVMLAYALMTPRIRAQLSRPPVMAAVRWGSLVALLALIVGWLLVPIDSAGLFRGVTLANSLLTAWIILAVTMPGPTASVLGAWPLRKLGMIGFAAYLFHWPVFLLLDANRTGLSGAPLFGVRVAAAIAAGALAYWVIEWPFRRKIRVPRLRLGTGLATCAGLLAVAVLVLPVNPPQNISLTVNDGSGPGDLDVVMPAGDGNESARILVVGDQTAGSMVGGFSLWNEDEPDAQFRVDTHVTADCPLGGAGTVRRFGETQEPSLDCEAWRWRLPKMLDAADYDAIVVLMGVADLGERQVDGEWRHLGDPTHDRWMRREISGLADVLIRADAPVLWLSTLPVRLDPTPDDPSTSWSQFDDNDPRRVDQLNALIRAAVGGPSGFETIDVNAWLYDREGGGFNPDTRVDAIFTDDGAGELVSWLAPQIFTAAGDAPTSVEGDENAEHD